VHRIQRLSAFPFRFLHRHVRAQMSRSGSTANDEESVVKRTALHVAASAGLVAATVLAAIFATTPAAADPRYPWCASYRTGSENCGFGSYEQCKFTVNGNGGFCIMNRSYSGPNPMRAQARKPRR
jgi:Protein of unknown function (DUF3551)